MDPDRPIRATGNVLGALIFIIYCSREMFQTLENRSNACVSTLLAVVHKPTDRPAVIVSLNGDFARFQEWCNSWCMIPNPNKTQALIVKG